MSANNYSFVQNREVVLVGKCGVVKFLSQQRFSIGFSVSEKVKCVHSMRRHGKVYASVLLVKCVCVLMQASDRTFH